MENAPVHSVEIVELRASQGDNIVNLTAFNAGDSRTHGMDGKTYDNRYRKSGNLVQGAYAVPDTAPRGMKGLTDSHRTWNAVQDRATAAGNDIIGYEVRAVLPNELRPMKVAQTMRETTKGLSNMTGRPVESTARYPKDGTDAYTVSFVLPAQELTQNGFSDTKPPDREEIEKYFSDKANEALIDSGQYGAYADRRERLQSQGNNPTLLQGLREDLGRAARKLRIGLSEKPIRRIVPLERVEKPVVVKEVPRVGREGWGNNFSGELTDDKIAMIQSTVPHSHTGTAVRRLANQAMESMKGGFESIKARLENRSSPGTGVVKSQDRRNSQER